MTGGRGTDNKSDTVLVNLSCDIDPNALIIPAMSSDRQSCGTSFLPEAARFMRSAFETGDRLLATMKSLILSMALARSAFSGSLRNSGQISSAACTPTKMPQLHITAP